MRIKLLVFAQARETFGFSERVVDCDPGESARDLVLRFVEEEDLVSLRVAVDCDFYDWDEAIGEAVEVAVIPPVSGG